MKYFIWTVAVWLPVIVLASVALATFTCANPNGCFVNGGFVAVVLVFVIGLPVYVIGLLVMFLWDWTGRRHTSNVASGPPGRKQGW